MPTYNISLENTPLSVFDELKKKIAMTDHTHFISLHQGKTTFPPCATLNDWKPSDFELLAHHHASPEGVPSLRRAIVNKLSNQHNKGIIEENVTIVCGATHGVGAVFKVILRPGDEVLVMSPQWLFTNGLIRAAGGRPVEVPVFLALSKDLHCDFILMLEQFITPKTRAIYFNTPNNPTGISLGTGALRNLAEFANKNDLWIVADNAYEIYDFTEEGFIDITQIPEAAERAFSIYTFSKTYAMPGYRVGYVLSPQTMAERMRKSVLYSIYSLSTASQYGALQALRTSAETLTRHHELAKQARDIIATKLKIPAFVPQGGFYTLLDLSEWRDGDTEEFINHCVAAGVSLAPGIAFGEHCAKFARACFLAVNHDDLHIGIQRLNQVYQSEK